MAHVTVDEQLDPEEQLAFLRSERATLIYGHSQEVSQLREGLLSRKIIGKALGLPMRDFSLTEDAAYARLQRRSSQANVELRDVAWEVAAANRVAGIRNTSRTIEDL